uniref:Uncharacterized protein n=1 Tax=Moniliophthora roreri TaxID=221103 RepID=A0A0W0G4F0_MONRR
MRVNESVDLELGMSNSLPPACTNNTLHPDERAEYVERNKLERDAISHAGSPVTATTAPQSCPPPLEELSPAREQLILEIELIAGQERTGVNRSQQPESGNVPTEQLQPPKILPEYGDKKRPNRPKQF